jgi:hypothetical protein
MTTVRSVNPKPGPQEPQEPNGNPETGSSSDGSDGTEKLIRLILHLFLIRFVPPKWRSPVRFVVTLLLGGVGGFALHQHYAPTKLPNVQWSDLIWQWQYSAKVSDENRPAFGKYVFYGGTATVSIDKKNGVIIMEPTVDWGRDQGNNCFDSKDPKSEKYVGDHPWAIDAVALTSNGDKLVYTYHVPPSKGQRLALGFTTLTIASDHMFGEFHRTEAEVPPQSVGSQGVGPQGGGPQGVDPQGVGLQGTVTYYKKGQFVLCEDTPRR